MTGLNEHPLRRSLSAEIRARPYGSLRAPTRASYLAVLSDEHGAQADHAHVTRLCKALNVDAPAEGANHFSADLGEFQLKWERHTEFATYTFYRDGPFDAPFGDPPIGAVPADWLKAIPGQVLAAVHIALEQGEPPERPFGDLAALFDNSNITGSWMLGNKAKVWTDFRIHEDGFGRILIRDMDLNRRVAGRLVQRLLEMETYRMLALLAFPLAREARPKVAAIERQLSEIVPRLAVTEGVEEERDLLMRLSGLAAEIEAVSASTNYRFSASRAYHGLVVRRVKELREGRIEGLQPPGEFLARRMVPAMETCESVVARQENLSQRIAHANDMLRTRVDVALEEQNQNLLMSMNRRAKLQLRLQETVEGLSVVAISYYLVGLVSYVAKSVKVAGVPINIDITVGVAIPFVLLAVWLCVRRLRKAATGAKDDGAP